MSYFFPSCSACSLSSLCSASHFWKSSQARLMRLRRRTRSYKYKTAVGVPWGISYLSREGKDGGLSLALGRLPEAQGMRELGCASSRRKRLGPACPGGLAPRGRHCVLLWLFG